MLTESNQDSGRKKKKSVPVFKKQRLKFAKLISNKQKKARQYLFTYVNKIVFDPNPLH